MAIESASRTLASSKDWHGSSYAIEAGPAMRSAPCRDARRSVKAGDSWSQPTWTPLVQPRPRPCARGKPLVGKGSMCRLGTLRIGPWRRARNRSRESGRRMFPRAISCSPVATSHGLSVRSLAASGFSAVGTERLDGSDPPGSPGPGWKASPRCGPCNRPNRKPAVCHRG
jgi:hypothetical protein